MDKFPYSVNHRRFWYLLPVRKYKSGNPKDRSYLWGCSLFKEITEKLCDILKHGSHTNVSGLINRSSLPVFFLSFPWEPITPIFIHTMTAMGNKMIRLHLSHLDNVGFTSRVRSWAQRIITTCGGR